MTTRMELTQDLYQETIRFEKTDKPGAVSTISVPELLSAFYGNVAGLCSETGGNGRSGNRTMEPPI